MRLLTATAQFAFLTYLPMSLTAPTHESSLSTDRIASASESTPQYQKCKQGNWYCYSEIANMGTPSIFPSTPTRACSAHLLTRLGYDMYQLTLQYCRDEPWATGCESCGTFGCQCTLGCKQAYFQCMDGDGWYQFRGRCLARPGQPCSEGQCR